MICHKCDGVVGSDCSCSDDDCEATWYPGMPTKCEFGCGKYRGTCTCKTTLPADLDEVRSRTAPAKKLADELREKAEEVYARNTQYGAENLFKLIITTATNEANKGKFHAEHRFRLHEFSIASADRTVKMLQEAGFKAAVQAQNWSSGYAEYTHVLNVSWS